MCRGLVLPTDLSLPGAFALEVRHEVGLLLLVLLDEELLQRRDDGAETARDAVVHGRGRGVIAAELQGNWI